jgi:hypothetical protein
MSNKKIIGLVLLAMFAMMQMSACFVAACHTEGFVSVFYFILGGISCLFGLALDFLLLIIAVDVFGGVFGSMAASIGKKDDEEKDEDEDDEEEDIEIVDIPE